MCITGKGKCCILHSKVQLGRAADSVEQLGATSNHNTVIILNKERLTVTE